MNKKGLMAFIASLVILTFVFGFDDGSTTFLLSRWLWNLAKVFLFVFVCLTLYLGAQEYIAKRHEASVEYELWAITRLKLKQYKRPKWSLPIGAVIAIIVSLVSYGRLYFTGIGSTDINWEKSKRTGRRYTNVSEYESALIIMAGPIALLLVLLICNWLALVGNGIGMLSTIAFWMLVINILPIPGLDGAKIFSFSRIGYIFLIILVMLNLLLATAGVISGVLLSLVIAVIITGLYCYKWES